MYYDLNTVLFSYKDESNLSHFPWIYSKSLCRLQCKISKMIETCGCLPFFYRTNVNERNCDIYGMSCISFYKHIFLKSIGDCHCFENCEDTKFHMKSKRTYTWLRSNSLRWEMDKPKYRIKREVIYSFADVLGLYKFKFFSAFKI